MFWPSRGFAGSQSGQGRLISINTIVYSGRDCYGVNARGALGYNPTGRCLFTVKRSMGDGLVCHWQQRQCQRLSLRRVNPVALSPAESLLFWVRPEALVPGPGVLPWERRGGDSLPWRGGVIAVADWSDQVPACGQIDLGSAGGLPGNLQGQAGRFGAENPIRSSGFEGCGSGVAGCVGGAAPDWSERLTAGSWCQWLDLQQSCS